MEVQIGTPEQIHAQSEAVERDLLRVIQRSLDRLGDRIVREFDLPTITAARPLTPDSLKALIDWWNEEVIANIRPVFLRAFKKHWGWVADQAAQGGLDVNSVVLGPNVRDTRASKAFEVAENRLSGIGETTWNEITTVLRDSFDEGASPSEAAEAVRKKVDTAISPARAATIARTETGAVVGAADQSIADELAAQGFTVMKEWLATPGPRTRPSHAAADGQIVPVGSQFQVGAASLHFPGDPTGPAEEVINCRCALLVTVAD